MLSDADYALLKSITDVTEREDIDSNELRYNCEMTFNGDEYASNYVPVWRRAWDHADYLNEKHYEDHISFCVIKCCQNCYVFDKVVARKLKLIP